MAAAALAIVAALSALSSALMRLPLNF